MDDGTNQFPAIGRTQCMLNGLENKILMYFNCCRYFFENKGSRSILYDDNSVNHVNYRFLTLLCHLLKFH